MDEGGQDSLRPLRDTTAKGRNATPRRGRRAPPLRWRSPTARSPTSSFLATAPAGAPPVRSRSAETCGMPTGAAARPTATPARNCHEPGPGRGPASREYLTGTRTIDPLFPKIGRGHSPSHSPPGRVSSRARNAPGRSRRRPGPGWGSEAVPRKEKRSSHVPADPRI